MASAYDPIPPCPHCGAERAIPIIFGVPTGEAFELVQRGERVLGGCSISVDSPRWQCRACRHQFGDHEDAFWRLFPNLPRPAESR